MLVTSISDICCHIPYLLSYSLFQEERRDDVTGIVESCKMHDLIHDFAQSISKSETLIVEERPGSNISHDVRHLNLIKWGEMVPTILGDVAERLQTLFSTHSFSNGVQVDLIRLRVLSLTGASDAKQLPTYFGNLKRLRYLDISGTQIEELPEFISELYNLQTFRFMDCRSLKMPPRGIGDLINLKHIYFSDEERMPANLGRLTNLQTLPSFFVGTTGGHKIEELGSLRELKGSLEIRQLELVTGKSEAEGANLKEKVVEHLIFCWSKGNGNQDEGVLEGLQPPSNIRRLSIIGYGGRNLSSWMLLLNNLVYLEIVSCKMLYRIPDVNELLSLQRLYVNGCDELTSLGDGDEALTSMSLKELDIYGCSKLKRLSVSGLSSLDSLLIYNCNELTSLGDGDEALTSMSLKKLSIYMCSKLKRLSVSGLSSLDSLIIDDCDELTSLGDGEGALTSLKYLSIEGCAKLERFLVSGLSSLETLSIDCCQVMRSIGDSLSSYTCLKELYLNGCHKWKFIPGLEGLFSLKAVTIVDCDGLKCVPTGLSSCTALEELRIESCLNLVSVPEELKHLPSLVDLRIWDCLNLKSFPEDILGSLSCLKTLVLGPFSEELEEFPSLSSTSTPTTAPLEFLRLEGWGKSLTLPHQIQLTALRTLIVESSNRVEKALLGNLSCLEDLKITNCPNLVSFQGELKELRSLEILDCPKLVGFLEKNLGCCTRLKRLSIGPFSEELGEFPSLSSIHASLEGLTLQGWGKLTRLPQIQHFTALKELSIEGFNGMESLPDWFNNLSSLRKLCIWNCPNKLKERCTKESGPDWHKISHIPYIRIDIWIIQCE